MTKEEAISELVVIKSVYSHMRGEYKPCVEALQMAIDLLKQTDTPHTETQMKTQNSNLTFEKADERCKGCNHYKLTCDLFSEICHYEPKDEPQDECAKEYEELGLKELKELIEADRKDEPQTETEIAKAIVHKMIDDAVIAEDAYPDLRQRMHDAVERLDEYYPSENERSE